MMLSQLIELVEGWKVGIAVLCLIGGSKIIEPSWKPVMEKCGGQKAKMSIIFLGIGNFL